ncbi:glycosyltransferase family 39 protein [Shewanella schlegeliana]|uniref:Glycosyltransferase family 39 protein n=1 Tax=Shewanella schlegeliana TaxID=190308 RepID=A0ABS1SZ63_9GAMM|nr:glycosyltransferase family 39 protein [Shewanella schlegeliana]MBL4913822.1 glycosyltransferase family 39 protein [Shewanella schlegeliana]MCL1108793.1 glycosyltransferase family 39 protein [Shewanella schlegeliana]
MTSKEFDVSYDKEISPSDVGSERRRLSQIPVLSLLLAFAVVARIHVALFYEVNWDEFYYLSFVYQYESGALSTQLQTFHVHFFNWLKWVSSNEVIQIKAARLVLVLFQILTGYFIYRIARRFVSTPAALFSVLCYFAFSFNIRMGASFRADPLTTFFLMSSLTLILSQRLQFRHLLIAGLCIAVSILITIKSLLYLPTFGLIALALYLEAPIKSRFLYKPIIVLSCALLSFYALYLLHGTFLLLPNSEVAAEIVSVSFDKTIKTSTFLPGFIYLKYSFFYDFLFWLTLIYGVKVAYFARLPHRQLSQSDRLILLSFCLPLCTIFFYRNAFPYFYSFMLAPVTVLCGVAWDGFRLNPRNNRETSVITSCLLLFIAVSITYHGFFIPMKKTLQTQQNFVELIHRLFPSPTSYIDCCSMIASYPKQGFFMSSWGMEAYLEAKQPVLKSVIAVKEPAFVIANNRFLNHSSASETFSKQLHPADLAALKQNYIPHWGALYVAGKQLQLRARNTHFSINIPGEYTLEATHPIIVNEQNLSPGETLFLVKGNHIAKPTKLNQEVSFRWGNHLYRPPLQSHFQPIFTGF